jgi:hypothetical protein
VEDWIFSSGSQENKVSFYERLLLNSSLGMINYVQRSNHICPTNPSILFQSIKLNALNDT